MGTGPKVSAVAAMHLAEIGFRADLTAQDFDNLLKTQVARREYDRFIRYRDDRTAGKVTGQQLFDRGNAHLKMTIATSTALIPMAPAWLEFWNGLNLPEGVLVDLGCGAGLLTTYYARQRHPAPVFGYDVSAVGIERAAELATRLGITNASFGVIPPGHATGFQGTAADVVVSTMVAREVEPGRFGHTERTGTLGQVQDMLRTPRPHRLAETAARIIAKGGVFVTFERADHEVDWADWIGALGAAGFGVDLARSRMLSWSAFLGEPVERALAFVAVKGAAMPDPDEVVRWLAEVSRTGDGPSQLGHL